MGSRDGAVERDGSPAILLNAEQPRPTANVAGLPPDSQSQPYHQQPEQQKREDTNNTLLSTPLSSSDSATNSSDEFNWDEDEEEELDPNSPRTTRPKNGEKIHSASSRRGRRLYLCLMRLSRPVRVILVGILGAGILITPLLVFQFNFLDSPARNHVYAWSLWFSIAWAAGCITFLVVDAIPSIVIRVIQLFGGQIERRKTQIELIFAVRGWLKLALDVSWAWIALSVIRSIRDPPGSYWVIINRVMQALFSASIIILVEKIFLRYVAINFHEKALADRLTENQQGLKALDRLSNAQPVPVNKRYPYNRRGHKSSNSVDLLGFAAGGGAGHHHNHNGRKTTNQSEDEVTEKDKGKEEKPATSSPPNSSRKTRRRERKKAVTSIIVDQLGEAIGQVALKDSKFNQRSDWGGLASARKLAKKLFKALSTVYPPRQHLLVDDFYPYFDTKAEADQAFTLFDKDGNGDISKKEMREAVQRIYRERKALTASLKDVGSAVAKLDAVLMCVALLAIIFVCLLIFNRDNTLESLVPLATIILGFSFVFGNSAQQLFESLIFIFSTHVFDVGDLVLIDDQPLFVREFGLFSTTFRRVDGQEIIAPNSLLASSKLIHNIRRSNSMWETTNLNVAYDTPLETIEQLRLGIMDYIGANSREWNNALLNLEKIEYMNAITLIVAIEHRPNWQDWGGRWARRTKLMKHLKSLLEQLEIRYTLPIQPVLVPSSGPGGPGGLGVGRAGGSDLGNAGWFRSAVPRAPPGLRGDTDQTFGPGPRVPGPV